MKMGARKIEILQEEWNKRGGEDKIGIRRYRGKR